ncbi:MAG TPA: hypothetical protein VNN18_06755 [Candidatus Xenobia bacterium]|nr:hypothetical protein [Candidatus Xenobia bacterium]
MNTDKTATAMEKTLELAPPERVIPLKVTQAGHVYRLRHVLRPPAAADWFAYEAALEPTVEELNDDAGEPCYRLRVRSTDAAAALWERLIARVDGYGEVSGRDWRALIPLAHKEAAVGALTLVAPATRASASPDGFYPLAVNEVPVALEAVVGGVAYPRLVHVFQTPTVEAERAYRRLLAETLTVRGGRDGATRTLIPARLPALVRLYDSLILRAEGYSVDGKPSTSLGVNSLRDFMDAWHKRIAVQALFGGLTAETPAAAPPPAEERP